MKKIYESLEIGEHIYRLKIDFSFDLGWYNQEFSLVTTLNLIIQYPRSENMGVELMSVEKTSKLTTAFGIPVGDDQNSLTAGPRFYAQKMVRCSSNTPSSLPVTKINR